MRPTLFRRTGTHDESGAVAVIVAILSVVLMVCAALAVDLGRAWASRGAAQDQADKAALAAAGGLPVQLSGPNAASTQLQAAKYAAYYIACNAIAGQDGLGVPCSSSLSPLEPTLDVVAAKLLSNGVARVTGASSYNPNLPAVWFPTVNQVAVAGAQATTEFGFGKVAGGDRVSTVKWAQVKVSSPGEMLPIALATDSTSITSGFGGCLTAQRDSAHSGNGAAGDGYLAYIPQSTNLPVVAVGKRSPDPLPFAYPAPYPTNPIRNEAQLVGMAISPSLDYSPSLTIYKGDAVTLNVLMRNLNNLGVTVKPKLVFFNLETGDVVWHPDYGGALSLTAGTDRLNTKAVPAQVYNTPGTWHVSVYMDEDITGDSRRWLPTGQVRTLDVVDRNEAWSRYDLDGCARYIASPRKDTGSAVTSGNTTGSSTMVRNILNGLDHGIGLNPGANWSSCAGRQGVDGTLYDNGANLNTGTTPNCVTIAATTETSLEVTKGWLGTPPGDATGAVTGRLDCTYVLSKGVDNCRTGRKFSLWGKTFNNDRLEDFIVSPDAITTPLSFAQDNYNGDGISLITPEAGRLRKEIYNSPRLFWAPLVSREGARPWGTGSTNGQQVRVLGYRPVFITQSTGAGWVQDLGRAWCNGNSVSPLTNPGMNPVVGEYGDGTTWTGVHLNNVSRGRSNENAGIINCNYTEFTKFRDPTRLQGLQFQTIAPRTMPDVPDTYSGPLTDYIGTGPRVVRLVR